jgi:hypothetical protein
MEEFFGLLQAVGTWLYDNGIILATIITVVALGGLVWWQRRRLVNIASYVRGFIAGAWVARMATRIRNGRWRARSRLAARKARRAYHQSGEVAVGLALGTRRGFVLFSIINIIFTKTTTTELNRAIGR